MDMMDIDEARIVDVTPKKKNPAPAPPAGTASDERRLSKVMGEDMAVDSGAGAGDSAYLDLAIQIQTGIHANGEGSELPDNQDLQNDCSGSENDEEGSESDTETLELQPTTMASFFESKRISDGSTNDKFLDGGTGTPIFGLEAGDAPHHSGATTGGRLSGIFGTLTNNPFSFKSNSAGHSSRTNGVGERFSRFRRRITPGSPWNRLRRVVTKNKLDIHKTEKAMEELRLHDGSKSGSAPEVSGPALGSADVKKNRAEERGPSFISPISSSMVEVDLIPSGEQAPGDIEGGPTNASTANPVAAQERILSLPYRRSKRELAKEIQKEVKNYKQEAEMTSYQLKAKLQLEARQLKGKIDSEIKEVQDATKKRIQNADLLLWTKKKTLKEHHLAGKCRSIVARYKTEKEHAEKEHQAKVEQLQKTLESKLLKLKMKKERKDRMLDQKVKAEMRAILSQIQLAKAQLNVAENAADNDENQLLDSLLADVAAVSDEDIINSA